MPARGNTLFRRMGLATVVFRIANHNGVGKHAFIAPPEDGKRTMGWHLFQWLDMVEVVAELGTFIFLAVHHGDLELPLLPDKVTQLTQEFRILGKAFHQNVAGTIKRGLGVGNTGLIIDIAFRCALWLQRGVVIQGIGQGLQTGFTGNLRFGSALGLIRQVEVFEAVLGVRRIDAGTQLIGQLALLLNAVEDRGTTVFQLTQITQAVFQGP